MEYNRAALKEQVKSDLRATKPRAVLVTLVFLAAVFVLDAVLEALGGHNPLLEAMEQISALGETALDGAVDEMEMAQQILEIMGSVAPSAVGMGLVFSLISSAVNWTLSFGYQGYCLGVVRGENPGFVRLLCAFPQWGWVLLTGLLITLFTALWALLIALAGSAAIVALMILMDNTALAATLSVVVLIGMVWAMLYITLRYTMANYILLDEKVDALEAIKRSKAMMRGRKWHYFELMISFFGWMLLQGLVSSLAASIAAFAALGSFFAGGNVVGMIMELAGGGDIFIQTLTWLLTLPILVWLRGYMTCAGAKFYDQMRRLDICSGVWETDRDYRAHYIPDPPPLRVPPQTETQEKETPKDE